MGLLKRFFYRINNFIIFNKIKTFDKGFIWNPSNCAGECYKSCDVIEYLDFKNCNCKNRLAGKLAEKCTENIEERRLVEITIAKNENKHKCSSCTLHIVLFSILFTINVGIWLFSWYLKKDVICVKFGTRTQTTI